MMRLWEKMKSAVFVGVVVGVVGYEVAAAGVVVASWLCLPCLPLLTNGPNKKI